MEVPQEAKLPGVTLQVPLVLRMTPYLPRSICPTCIGPYVHLAAVCPHRAGAVPVTVDQQHSTLPIRTPCPLGLEEKHPTGMGAEPARFLPPSLLPVVGGLGKPYSHIHARRRSHKVHSGLVRRGQQCFQATEFPNLSFQPGQQGLFQTDLIF